MPASTSPLPAVARSGAALELIAARPSGAAHHRVGSFQHHDGATFGRSSTRTIELRPRVVEEPPDSLGVRVSTTGAQRHYR